MSRAVGPATLAILTLVLVLALNVRAISSFPPPHCDEATYGSIAYELLNSGKFRSAMTGDLFGLDQYNSAVGRLWVIGMALFIKILGVQLFAARLYSMVGAIITVWLTYMVARELRDRATGVVAALLVATSWKIFYAAHMARPEIWLAASVLLALLWMISSAQDITKGREALPAGMLCVLPLEFHALGGFFLAGLLFGAAFYFGWVRRSWRVLSGFAGGVACGLLIWILVHFVPNPSLAWQQWTQGITKMGLVGSPSVTASLRDFGSWFAGQFILNNRFLGILESGVYFVGVVYVLRRPVTQGAIITVVTGSSLLVFALTNSQKSPQYAVVWVPMLSILSAQAIVALGNSLAARDGFPENSHVSWAYLTVVMPVIVLFLAGNVWLTIRYPRSGYERTLALMRHHVPKGATVLGDPIWWWGFAEDRQYIGDWYLAAQSQFGDDVLDVRAELEHLGADYVILDDSIACTLSPSQVDKQLRSVVHEMCHLKASIEGAWLGQGTYESQFQFGQVSGIYACGSQL